MSLPVIVASKFSAVRAAAVMRGSRVGAAPDAPRQAPSLRRLVLQSPRTPIVAPTIGAGSRRPTRMPTHPNPYRQDLDRNPANHVALTPLSLLEWAADVYPGQLAVIHGDIRRSWAEVRERSRRLASVLAA